VPTGSEMVPCLLGSLFIILVILFSIWYYVLTKIMDSNNYRTGNAGLLYMTVIFFDISHNNVVLTGLSTIIIVTIRSIHLGLSDFRQSWY